MNSGQSQLQAAQLCKRCAQFYANQNTNRLCSQCCKASRPISAFRELCGHVKVTSSQKDSKQIRNGLVLYAFRGYHDWRLRSKHFSDLIINNTGSLIRVASRPSSKKTMKYVRRLRDIRKGTYDRQLESAKRYYLSYRVTLQLKAITSLRVLIPHYISKLMFKKLCQFFSKLNPHHLVLNFLRLNSDDYKHTRDYLGPFLVLLQRMRNLRYLDTEDITYFYSSSNFDPRLSKYWKIINTLPHLSDINLGTLEHKYPPELIKIFLDHAHLKKIQSPMISFTSGEDIERFFENLSHIKELDRLEIRTNSDGAIDDSNPVLHVPLTHFLSSLKFVDALVINHTEPIRHVGSNDDSGLFPQIANIRELVIEGYINNFSIKVMQAAKDLDSFQINVEKVKRNDIVINVINKILAGNLNLKELTLKFGDSVLVITKPLVRNVILPNLKSFSLDLSKCSGGIRNSELEPFIGFLTNQPKLQNIDLKLSIPIDFYMLEMFLEELAELQKLNSITLFLEQSEKVLLSSKSYISDLNAFCNALRKSQSSEFELHPNGYVVLKS